MVGARHRIRGVAAVIFSYVAPGPALAEFVRDYLIAHFVFGQEMPAPLKPYAPKPEQGMTFFVRGAPRLANRTGDGQQAPAVSVFGQQVERCDVGLGSEFLMLRVHFRPGALFRLLRVPLPLFAGGYCDAEPVLGRDIRDVSEQLAAARGYAEMIAVIEACLLRRIRAVPADAHPADRAAAAMTAAPGRFSLDRLADEAGLGPRQFNRTFTERLGVGPKLYSRVVRFHRAYRFKEAHPGVDWLTVAVNFGYSDYQHLVRDFKQFTGTTPTRWAREDRRSPERLLDLSAR